MKTKYNKTSGTHLKAVMKRKFITCSDYIKNQKKNNKWLNKAIKNMEKQEQTKLKLIWQQEITKNKTGINEIEIQ